MKAPNKKKKPKFSTKTRYKCSKQMMYKELRDRFWFIGGFYNGWLPTVRRSKNFVIKEVTRGNRSILVKKYTGPYALTAKYEVASLKERKGNRCRIPEHVKRKLK